MSEIVSIKGNWAYIMVHDIKDGKEGMVQLIETLKSLLVSGFHYSHTSYDTGYYGAAEDITMEFFKK